MGENDQEIVIAQVGRKRDGNTFVTFPKGLIVDGGTVAMMREAVDITIIKLKEHRDRMRKPIPSKDRWWPDVVKCNGCGCEIKLETEPESYVIFCACGGSVVMETPPGKPLIQVFREEEEKAKRKANEKKKG